MYNSVEAVEQGHFSSKVGRERKFENHYFKPEYRFHLISFTCTLPLLQLNDKVCPNCM